MNQEELETLYRRVAKVSAPYGWGHYERCQFISVMANMTLTEVGERLMEVDDEPEPVAPDYSKVARGPRDPIEPGCVYFGPPVKSWLTSPSGDKIPVMEVEE